MAKHKKRSSQTRPIWLFLLALTCFSVLMWVLLRGANVAVLSPKGVIAGDQRRLLVLSLVLLLEIAIPTLTLFYFFAWKYRETNQKAMRNQDMHYDKSLVFGIWAAPSISMLLLASIMIPATHKLAPRKLIDTGAKPFNIEVVAMRWKWLFIYPEQNIATVNFIQVPAGTPVQFDLTGDEVPMSSFWIPQLGGQLYAMTGHVNRLNLVADKPGDFAGSSAEINGDGFAGMKFTVRASATEEFNQWVEKVKQSPDALDSVAYQKLLRPSQSNPAAYYAQVEAGLYDTMLAKYSGSHGQHTEQE